MYIYVYQYIPLYYSTPHTFFPFHARFCVMHPSGDCDSSFSLSRLWPGNLGSSLVGRERDLGCASDTFEGEGEGEGAVLQRNAQKSTQDTCTASKPLWLAAVQRAVSKPSWFDDSTIYTFLFKSSSFVKIIREYCLKFLLP